MQKPFILSVEIPGPFNILSHQTWLKPSGRKPPATGEAIAIQAVQASSSNADADASNLINRSGLRDRDIDGLNEHSGDARHMWLSAKGQTQGWLQFDLGTVQEVGTICIWNFNDTWRTDRGLRQADLSVWTAESGWQKVRDDLLLEQAEGGDDYDEPVVVQLEGVKAQKIRLDDFATFGDVEFAGLSEVQFFGPRGSQAANPSPADGKEPTAITTGVSSRPGLISQR